MKLLRYGPQGQEKPGVLDRDGKIRDLSAACIADIDAGPARAGGARPAAEARSRQPAAGDRRAALGRASTRVSASSSASASTIVDHAKETGNADPERAGRLFMKATSSHQRPQ